MTRKFFVPAALAAALMATSACAPVVNKRGWIPDEGRIDSIQIGEADRTMVRDTLGTPSATAAFSPEIWFYITSEEEQTAFLNPQVVRRDILAVEFSEQGTVADMRRYTLEDGKLFAFVDRETPTRGRELTFLQQMFGNVSPAGALGGSQSGGTRPGDR